MKSKGLIMIRVLILTLVSLAPVHAAYQVGDTVADWTLYDADGNPHRLYDYMGKIVMINFWSDT
ncbi:redoxin domain-containing protein [bacterium]|nr:redoxin domain-containing protein [candidate division CSSED10-310 bacterium]